MMDNNEARALLNKYNKGICTPEEKTIVESWFLTWEDAGSVPAPEKIEQVNRDIWESLPVHKRPIRKDRRLWSTGVAAAVLLIVGVGLYFYQSHYNYNTTLDSAQGFNVKNGILPGSNKAYLTLANGRRIALNDAANGELAKEAGIIITKTKDGQVVYTLKDPHQGGDDKGIESNTITTPKGGQWQINLPDGSKVWLNAASSLKYPTRFSGKERKVELTGEAYFEVAKMSTKYQVSGIGTERRMPFIVKTAKQEVEVLGTHFNINSYADESATKTTLLEGSVRVNGIVLKPGQQSLLTNNGNIQVTTVDTEEAVAWKEGLFMFNDESLENILLNISRWYNVAITYQDEKVKQLTFGLNITRYTNISKVLRMLELTKEVHFKVEGKKIIVMK